jgi:hypothetical protein
MLNMFAHTSDFSLLISHFSVKARQLRTRGRSYFNIVVALTCLVCHMCTADNCSFPSVGIGLDHFAVQEQRAVYVSLRYSPNLPVRACTQATFLPRILLLLHEEPTE